MPHPITTNPEGTMDDDQRFHSILDDGYVIEWVESTSNTLHPHPRAWTVGRTLSGRPELLVSGLNSASSQMLIDAMVEFDLAQPLEVNTKVGRVLIVEAEPAVALGAVTRFPTPDLKVYQLVWSTRIDGLDPDQDQKVYTRGSTILTDPYGG